VLSGGGVGGLMGGLLGGLVAVWAIPLLVRLSPVDMRALGPISMNQNVLAFSIAVSLLSGTLFGLAPALHASRVNLNESLKEGERTSSGTHRRTRSTLAVAQIAPPLGLPVRRGLLVESFVRLIP